MSFQQGLSGLNATSKSLEVIGNNIANANTTRTETGEPYRRKIVQVAEDNINDFGAILQNEQEIYQVSGVMVEAIVDDQSPLKAVYNPSHPDADENGYVMMPNVDTTTEMVEMIEASRSYEANVTAFNAIKQMATNALTIGK